MPNPPAAMRRLPGRLGTPGMALREDPRADPRMIAAMAPHGLADPQPPPPVDANSPIEELLVFCDEAETAYELVNDVFTRDLPPVEGVSMETRAIRGIDGNEVVLHLARPAEAEGPLPGILHLHGGGMVVMSATGPIYERWRTELAATGLVIASVEFRNAGGRLGPHPFPAGLHDCASGLYWMAGNAAALGISGVVVSGESGGGNLTLATVLKAKRDGRLADVAGAYAQCPFISNAYASGDPDLPSLVENDEYGLSCTLMASLSRLYDPEGSHGRNPLAWPLHATPEDLAGLPPHVISVNELDPLRDEGLAYFRKLLAAGVSASCRTINGTSHAQDIVQRAAMPDVYLTTIYDIKRFADRVCGGG